MNATQSYKILVPVQFFSKVPSSRKHPYLPAFVHGWGKSGFSPHLLEPFGFYRSMLISDASTLLKFILKR